MRFNACITDQWPTCVVYIACCLVYFDGVLAGQPTSALDGVIPTLDNDVTDDNGTKYINIIGLLPITGNIWPAGDSIKLAVEMALASVNSDPDILRGYRLRMFYADTQCEQGVGLNSMYRLLYNPPVKHVIYAGGCSTVCSPVSKASNHWNVAVISGSCTSSTLSERSLYSNFFRTVQPDIRENPGHVALMNHFRWRKIAIIHQENPNFETTIDDLASRLQASGISIITKQVFSNDPRDQLRNIKNYDARIVYAMFYEDVAIRVLCQAYTLGLYGPMIQWILPDWFSHGWFTRMDSPCQTKQIVAVLNYSVSVGTLVGRLGDEKTFTPSISGLDLNAFKARYSQLSGNKTLVGSKYSPFYYDAMWSVALVFNKTIQQLETNGSQKSIDSFSYQDSEIFEMVKRNFYSLRFGGVIGDIKYNIFGDANLRIQINQFRDNKMNPVALYRDEGSDQNLQLIGDGIMFRASIGISVTICLLVFNIYFKNHRIIKMSSPKMNDIILVGCIISYTSIYMADIQGSSYQTLCHIRPVSYNIGFTITFGAMLAKTWRVHKVLTESKKKLQRIVIKDYHLMIAVALVCSIDVSMLTLQEIFSPLTLNTVNSTIELIDNDADRLVQLQVYTCSTSGIYYFKTALMAWHTLMLAFGGFIAWETRNVKVDALNDSKQIAICIYNMAVLSILEVVITFLMDDNTHGAYLFGSLFCLASTLLTECLIFVPKALEVMTSDNKVAGSGGGVQLSFVHSSTRSSSDNP